MRIARLSFVLPLIALGCEDPVSTPGGESSGTTEATAPTSDVTTTQPTAATESTTGEATTDAPTDGGTTSVETDGDTNATETTGEQELCPPVGSITISGTIPGQLLGWRVSMAGDFDGDGIGDYSVAAPQHDRGFATDAGRVYLVRGGPLYEDFDVADLGSDIAGWRIEGEESNDRAGEYLASGGDINGDGRDDIVIGSAIGGAGSPPEDSGRVSIVYGNDFGSGDTTIELADVRLGEHGIAVDGRALVLTGIGSNLVTNTGDVNDDGFNDFLFGSPLADGLLGGRADLIYGGDDLVPIAMPDTGPTPAQGVAWTTDAATFIGLSVSGGGDVNGDGVDDVLFVVGGVEAAIFVMFGGEDVGTRTIDDVIAGVGGFRILFDPAQEFLPANSANATIVGDVNNDGFADIVMGGNRLVNPDTAPEVFPTALVVLGKAGTDDVSLLDVEAGVDGFVASGNGAYVNGRSGAAVGPVGDMNADGIGDWFMSAAGDPVVGSGLEDGLTGRVYVVYGDESGEEIDLDAVAEGEGGFIFEGVAPNNNYGRSVASGSDINGDMIPDVIVGIPQSGYVGAARVHFGFNETCPRVK